MKVVHVVCALIVKDNLLFATQRGYGEFKDGWEFPGGKIEENETAQAALVREIKEELNSEIEVDEFLCTVEEDYPNFHLIMECYWAHLVSGELSLLEHEAAAWLDKDHLESVDWLAADLQIIRKIQDSNYLV